MNQEVSLYLDSLNHPLRSEIDVIRTIVLEAQPLLEETIKWNGPNYSYHQQDRITLKIHPPKSIQVIFHLGAKTLIMPEQALIEDNSGLLIWRGHDRAIASFKAKSEIEANRSKLTDIVLRWLEASYKTSDL